MSHPVPRLLLAVCVVLLAFTRAASAEDPAERAAKRHYDRGKKLFALQKFDDALDQFQKAFDAAPIPDFLFNIGQCQRNLGDYEAAVFSYKRYLKLDPEAENRDQVEELIEELELKIDEANTERLRLGKRRQEGDGKTIETAEAAPVYKKWWLWTGIAVVTAGAGVGIYAATRPGGGPPDTDLGLFEFNK